MICIIFKDVIYLLLYDFKKMPFNEKDPHQACNIKVSFHITDSFRHKIKTVSIEQSKWQSTEEI